MHIPLQAIKINTKLNLIRFMITFEQFLDDPIPITKNKFMRRKDYYKKYIPNCDPRDFYNQLVKIWTDNDERKK